MKNSAKTVLTVLLIFISAFCAQSQILIDYAKYREKVVGWGCQKFDKASVNKTLKDLLEIDTARITGGLYEFYYDIAMAYYMKAALDNNYEFFNNSIMYFNKCIQVDPLRTASYQNLALIYKFLKMDELESVYLELQNKHTIVKD
jgi:hypothetical protein